MMWIKRRGGSNNWTVYHKGLNNGTNPQNYGLHLNTSEADIDDYGYFADTAPNAKSFQVGYDATTGSSGESYLALLFASVSGISSVGSYSGNNSSSGPTVTTGFSPRFILIKRSTGVDNWFVFDTLRGISNSGNDARLKLDESGGQTTNGEWLSISSTGFTLKTSDGGVNANSSYIYYAHA